MHIFRPLIFAAAFAGVLGGLLLTVLQQYGTVPLILEAEMLERNEPTPAGHGHQQTGVLVADIWVPQDGIERTAYTLLANMVTGVAFSLLLVAGITISRCSKGWRDGVLWGLGGFAVFVMAPSFGLPPELPGMAAAPLGARQLWWVATACATAAGLAVLAFRRRPVWISLALALAMSLTPHLVGAPQSLAAESGVPHELAHRFEVAVAVTNLIFWLALGGLNAQFLSLFTQRQEPRGAL